MIPLRDENPSSTVPFVTRALILVNVVVFLYEITLGPELRGFMLQWGMVPSRITDAFVTGGEPLGVGLFTPMTSMFLHGGWAHLIGNMWYLWIFGDNVEDRLGRGRFLSFYLVSGLAAALIHFVTNPSSTLPTVGASGAIAGVLGAYAAAFPRARVITLVPLIVIFQIVALPALVVLGLWFVFQFFSGALALAGPQQGGVAWWAHIGGFAFGYLAMRVVDRRPRRPRWMDPARMR